MSVVGIDGCPGGWIAMSLSLDERSITPRFHPTFTDAIGSYPHALAIGVDIPIGLSADGPRRCDVEARRVLGPRRSSVFPAPDPRVIAAATYEEALELSRSLTGKGISKQGYAIYAKVAEANRAMTTLLQGWVFEVHPEVSFWALNGGTPMQHHKSTTGGYEERRSLLSAALGIQIAGRDEARALARHATPDDFLDSTVAAWSAHRVATGTGGRLPSTPSLDGAGIRMEIAY